MSPIGSVYGSGWAFQKQMSATVVKGSTMTMHRELNPQLFGNQTQVEKIGQPVDPQKPAQGIMGQGGQKPHTPADTRAVPYPNVDVKALEHQMSTLKLAFMQMERKMETTANRLEELARTTYGRLDRFAQAFARMEEINNNREQDNTTKFANVFAKVNERKLSDVKVQELVDRHNTIIRNFENRLLSLQRVISEQEMTLHNAQAALEESRIGRRPHS